MHRLRLQGYTQKNCFQQKKVSSWEKERVRNITINCVSLVPFGFYIMYNGQKKKKLII